MYHPLFSKLACAAFFLLPGLFYGTLMARLPAIKEHLELGDSMIGTLLFVFGVVGVFGLLVSERLINRFSSRLCLQFASCVALAGLLIEGLADSFYILLVGAAILGISVSILDIAMNTQGVLFEKKIQQPTMNLFHASYSFGAVFASGISAICAKYKIGVELNFIILGVPCVLLALLLRKFLLKEEDSVGQKQMEDIATTSGKKMTIPAIVFLCGICACLGECVEGSVGEWGALYLTGEKGASQSLAALVYGVFSLVTFTARMFADKLRKAFGENNLMLCGLVLGVASFVLALTAASPIVVLVAYGFMGLGLAPLAPTLLSVAGRNGKIPVSRATSIVALMTYSGLLFFPPMIGYIAEHIGLHNALYVPLALLCVIGPMLLCMRKVATVEKQ